MSLYINNQTISTLSELRSCFKNKEAAEIGSPLFNELKELFIDGDLKEFLGSLGECKLVEKIDGIMLKESDSEMMRLLIAAITDEKPDVVFNPLDYLEIMLAYIKGDEAFLLVKVLKQAHEKVEFIIKQGINSKRAILNLADKKVGAKYQFKSTISLDGGEVLFLMNGTRLEQTTMKDENFSFERISKNTKTGEEKFNYRINFIYVEGGFLDNEKILPFYMMDAPVTQAMYDDYCVWSFFEDKYGKGPDYPAYNVNYDVIVNEFLPSINKTFSQAGIRFRLPTSSEWEFAARGGNRSKGYKFAGGDDCGLVAWYNGNAHETNMVRQKSCNELGFFDMSGNVCEWCSDELSGSGHALCGGSWNHGEQYCSVKERIYRNPSIEQPWIGFRLVAEVDLIKQAINR